MNCAIDCQVIVHVTSPQGSLAVPEKAYLPIRAMAGGASQRVVCGVA